MGCGCGGRKNTARPNITAPVTPRPANSVNARQVQTQSAQRQAMVQQAKERLQQNAVNQRNMMGAHEDIEKRRRIQISLRKKNGGT